LEDKTVASAPIQFCDVCQGSVPGGQEIRLANGAVYCRPCYVKLANKAGAAKGAAAPGLAPPPPVKVSLPAWSIVTACVTILLLALTIGVCVFLVMRLKEANNQLAEMQRVIDQTQRDLAKMDADNRQALIALLGQRAKDPDFAGDSSAITDILKQFMEAGKDYRKTLDATLDDIDRGGRARPRRPRDRRDTP